jgi:sporulation protein YlmC with PRC-barrel domain
MSEAEFDIGSEVACSDGVVGDLTRVIVDPVARAITHLVVQPKERHEEGRLVPIDFVVSSGAEIRLKCTKAQFGAFEEAEDSEFLPGTSGQYGYKGDEVLSLPYYGLHGTGLRMGSVGAITPSPGPHEAVYDHVPVGEVEVRRGDHVRAADGPIGHVKGLVIDRDDHHVTHFLLEEGHLWGHKTVAIPITAVTRVGDGVRLSLSKDEVKNLPAVDVDHPA